MRHLQNSKAFRNFARHVFLTGVVYKKRNEAQRDLNAHLQNMRKSIIRMKLSYTDVDRLKEKIKNLVNWERRYAKFFKVEDDETKRMKMQISALESELRSEKEEKQRVIEEAQEKIRQLTEALENIKSHTRRLLMEKAKRHQRLKALDKKIKGEVDMHNYYRSRSM